jgi:hypothetical protein
MGAGPGHGGLVALGLLSAGPDLSGVVERRVEHEYDFSCQSIRVD